MNFYMKVISSLRKTRKHVGCPGKFQNTESREERTITWMRRVEDQQFLLWLYCWDREEIANVILLTCGGYIIIVSKIR